MSKKFTIKPTSVLMLLLILTGLNANAQMTNPQYNSRIGQLSKSIVSNRQAPITYRDGNVEVTVMMNDFQYPYGMSPDGNQVAIASFEGEAGWLWTSPNSIMDIPGYVFDANNDGMVCGYYTNDEGVQVGGYWEPYVGWTFIGMHPDYPQLGEGQYNSIWAMNEDGSILTGMQYTSGWETFPFIWTRIGGYEDLPTLGSNGRSNSISDDGSIVGGWVANDFGTWLPSLWVDKELQVLTNDYGGEVNSVSPAGNYATGYVTTENTNAFVWSEANGFQVITNTLFSGYDASASGVAVSNDGVVFGYANNYFPPFPDTRVGFATNENGEMITFNEYAVAHGWAEAANWTFCMVTSVTPDGNTVMGSGFDADGNGVSFKVNFDPAPPTPPTHYLTLLAYPEEYGSTFGSGEYQAGSEVTVAAFPNDEYMLINWTDENGNIVSEEEQFQYTMPDQDMTLTANFDYDGVSENAAINARIFPNPASNLLNIRTSESNVTVKILDLQGRVVLEQQLQLNNTVNLESIDNGLYFIQLNANGKQSVSKLQILH